MAIRDREAIISYELTNFNGSSLIRKAILGIFGYDLETRQSTRLDEYPVLHNLCILTLTQTISFPSNPDVTRVIFLADRRQGHQSNPAPNRRTPPLSRRHSILESTLLLHRSPLIGTNACDRPFKAISRLCDRLGSFDTVLNPHKGEERWVERGTGKRRRKDTYFGKWYGETVERDESRQGGRANSMFGQQVYVRLALQG